MRDDRAPPAVTVKRLLKHIWRQWGIRCRGFSEDQRLYDLLTENEKLRKSIDSLAASKHVLTIDRWHSAWLDRALVRLYARMAGIPPATGKRRVSLTLTLAPRQHAADPDAYWKSALDALVRAGLLLDDNRQGVELGNVVFRRGKVKATAIVLEDVAKK